MARPRPCSTPPWCRVRSLVDAGGHRAGRDQGAAHPQGHELGRRRRHLRASGGHRQAHPAARCRSGAGPRARPGCRPHDARPSLHESRRDRHRHRRRLRPTLLAEGKVIPSFAERRDNIERQLLAAAAKQGALLNEYADLLDEVAALVEHPTYVGEFEAEFLAVPQECLIPVLHARQPEVLPLFDGAGKLPTASRSSPTCRWPTRATSSPATPAWCVRACRTRASSSSRTRSRSSRPACRAWRRWSITTSSAARLERVERLRRWQARSPPNCTATSPRRSAPRAAKADLVTDMVGEFPELQGIMGRYYALADGEGEVVADAIQAHYQPRFAATHCPPATSPPGGAGRRKLDALVGFFGIGTKSRPATRTLRAAPRRARRVAHPDRGAAAARAAQAHRHRRRRLPARPAHRRGLRRAAAGLHVRAPEEPAAGRRAATAP